jgi:uncharacterized OsmC-like protein
MPERVVIRRNYARHHRIELDEVELVIDYQRVFKDDCEHCEEISKSEEQIKMDISFKGNLTPQEYEKHYKVSLQCPIHKMLKNGIEVKSQLAKTKDPDSVQS